MAENNSITAYSNENNRNVQLALLVLDTVEIVNLWLNMVLGIFFLIEGFSTLFLILFTF